MKYATAVLLATMWMMACSGASPTEDSATQPGRWAQLEDSWSHGTLVSPNGTLTADGLSGFEVGTPRPIKNIFHVDMLFTSGKFSGSITINAPPGVAIPAVGVYPVLRRPGRGQLPGHDDYFSTAFLTFQGQSPEENSGSSPFYVATAGELEVTASSPHRVEGSFELMLSRRLTFGCHEGDAACMTDKRIRVVGTFSAPPGTQFGEISTQPRILDLE